MTKKRDFKRVVRERMEKTGERYSTARAHVLGHAPATTVQVPGVIDGYHRFGGQQGDTAVLRNVFAHAGIQRADGTAFSEALVYGLCGGIGFLYSVFEYAGFPPMLTLGGRSRSMPDAFASEGLARAGAELTVRQTGGAKAARKHLDEARNAGKAAICTVDTALLPYYGVPAKMAGMTPQLVAVVGRDGDDAWLDDRSVRPVRISMEDLARARAGYTKAKHRLVTVERRDGHDLGAAVVDALGLTAVAYDEPPVPSFKTNVGTAGLKKWARLLTDTHDKKGWPQVFASGATAYAGLRRAYDCINHDYSAPAAGRLLYAEFLAEAAMLTGLAVLADISGKMREAAALWDRVSSRICASDPTVGRGCALSDQRAELIDDQAGGAVAEMTELWQQRRALAADCTIDESAARAIYGDIAALVSAIAEVEQAAVAEIGAVAR